MKQHMHLVLQGLMRGQCNSSRFAHAVWVVHVGFNMSLVQLGVVHYSCCCAARLAVVALRSVAPTFSQQVVWMVGLPLKAACVGA